MRYARVLGVILALGLPALAVAGDIQVTCEPGLRVYLDGTVMGISSANQDGYFLMDVPDGKHTIRVDKPGYLPQGFQVEVTKLPIQIKVGKFIPVLEGLPVKPEPPATMDVGDRVGQLVITSAPQNCTVSIDGKSQEKGAPYITIGSLSAGKHTISFSRAEYEPISTVIEMEPGVDMTVRGDLIDGKVEATYEGTGSIRITSTPQSCTIHFLGMTREKTSAVMNISYLPAGRHHMVVSWGGREMSTDVLITDRHRTIVNIDFGADKVPFQFSYEPE